MYLLSDSASLFLSCEVAQAFLGSKSLPTSFAPMRRVASLERGPWKPRGRTIRFAVNTDVDFRTLHMLTLSRSGSGGRIQTPVGGFKARCPIARRPRKGSYCCATVFVCRVKNKLAHLSLWNGTGNVFARKRWHPTQRGCRFGAGSCSVTFGSS